MWFANSGLLLSNLAAYSLQIGLVVGIAGFAPALLRLRAPGAKLAFWHVLLLACLLAPLATPWNRPEIAVTGSAISVDARSGQAPAIPAPVVRPARFSQSEIILAVLGAGALIRLIWLAVGLWRLRRYRQRSEPLVPKPSWGVEAEIRLSAEVTSPVTFGFRKPVILLPVKFPEMAAATRDAVLAHECLHVRRYDWLFTIVEESIRAAFWFHPAIWWLLGEIQLAREQAVDRAVVEITRGREEYVDALLAIAGAKPRLDLAPAPLFLRKRHLKARVFSILKEPHMSKTRLFSVLAASVCILAASCWLVAGVFPLAAAPQVVADGPGVTVDLGGAALMHRTRVNYPADGLAKRIEGLVVVQTTLDAAGNVSDARVLSGPDELRKSALTAVLQWHFAKDAAGATRIVNITFKASDALPQGAAGATGYGSGVYRAGGGVTPGGAAQPTNVVVTGGQNFPVTTTGIQPDGANLSMANHPVTAITVTGLSDSARDELLAKLPVHVGDIVGAVDLMNMMRVMKEYDEHLTYAGVIGPNSMTIRIAAPGSSGSAALTSPVAVFQPAQTFLPDGVFRPGGGVTAPTVIYKAEPAYSDQARAARLQGTVVLYVIVGPDGVARNITVQKGVGMGLDEKAVEAVSQWKFSPGRKDGQPVPVEAYIEVNFRLLDNPPAAAPQGDVRRITVGGFVEQAKLIPGTKVAPEYPALARSARIQGHVILHAAIGTNGQVIDLTAVSGHPMLIPAAIAAVRQWMYQPTVLNDSPVEVDTEIDISFTLQD